MDNLDTKWFLEICLFVVEPNCLYIKRERPYVPLTIYASFDYSRFRILGTKAYYDNWEKGNYFFLSMSRLNELNFGLFSSSAINYFGKGFETGITRFFLGIGYSS